MNTTLSQQASAQQSAHSAIEAEKKAALVGSLVVLLAGASWTEQRTANFVSTVVFYLGRYTAAEVEEVLQDVGLKIKHPQQIAQALGEAIEAQRSRKRKQREYEHPSLPSPENAGKERWPEDILALHWEGRPWRDGPKSQEATNAMNDQLRRLGSPIRYDRNGTRFRCTNWGWEGERPSNLDEKWKPVPPDHPRSGPLTRQEIDGLSGKLRSMGLRLGHLTYDTNGILQERTYHE